MVSFSFISCVLIHTKFWPILARCGSLLDRDHRTNDEEPTAQDELSNEEEQSNVPSDSIHDLIIENNDLKLQVDSQKRKITNQRTKIVNLRKENGAMKQKLLLRNTFKHSYRKKQLGVRKYD